MMHENTVEMLQSGEIELAGQFLWGSNYTLLVKVSCDGQEIQAVYKPTRGVRPLWDFESGSLARREVAAYFVSEQLGWDLVPPTVFRRNGPMGPGSLQLYIDHDPAYHFFNFSSEDLERLKRAAAFDVIINNADRKGGHFIVDPDGRIWLIDHGICFHEETKLRTVLWNFADEPLPEADLACLAQLRDHLDSPGETLDALQSYLSPAEIHALVRRIQRLLDKGVYPNPPANSRPYPWPLV